MSRARIMYIENKSGGLSGPARIGRVRFSKSGQSLHYQGKTFETLKGNGFKSKEGLINSRFHSEIWFSGDPQGKFGGHRLIRGPVHGRKPPSDGPWPASGPTFPTPLP